MAKRAKFKLNEERIKSFFGAALIVFFILVFVLM